MPSAFSAACWELQLDPPPQGMLHAHLTAQDAAFSVVGVYLLVF